MSRRFAFLLVSGAVLTVIAAASYAAVGPRGTPSAGPRPAGCAYALADDAFAGASSRVRRATPRLWRGLRAPGMAVAVAVRGRVVWAAECGYADRGRRVRVRPATRFRIGSVSKTLTSALLGRLLDRGAVELDAPVQRYVPAFPRKTSEITLRLLAGHLAGIRHYRTRRETLNRRHFPSVEAALAVFARDPLVAEPGAAFSYSSYGWNLLGAALARASGSKFATLVREELVRPLGLRATGLASTGRTRFYELTNDGRAVPAPRIDLSDRLPSGGFTASARDVAVVASALASGFVRPETANALFTPQRTRTGEVTGYGLGWEVAPSPVGRLVGHTGAVVGGTAAVLLHPATGVALAIATNVGTITAAAPPRPRPDTPEPPALLLPFLAER